jgi:hypothetical protein
MIAWDAERRCFGAILSAVKGESDVAIRFRYNREMTHTRNFITAPQQEQQIGT